MAVTREAIVLCLDVGPFMRLREEETAPSALEQALECISWILQRKIFTESKDEFALVLFGTKETKNDLADDVGGYKNISVARGLQTADWDLVKYVQNEIAPSNLACAADFVDVITVSLDLLLRTESGKKYAGKQLVLFSNLGCPFGDDQVDKIIKAIKSSGVEFIVFGPRLYLADDESNDAEGGDFPGKLKKSAQQELGEQHMTRILNEVDGLAYSFREALSLLSKFTMRAVRPTPWKCNLELGSQIKIPICMYVKTKKAKVKQAWKWSHAQDPDAAITMQKTYHKRDVGDEEKEQDEGATQGPSTAGASTSGPSTAGPPATHDNEDVVEDDSTQISTEKEVSKEDLVKVYNYGTTAVPLDQLDLDAMKYKTAEKCLKILTFIDLKQAKRHYFLGDGCYHVFNELGDDEGGIAFLAFWKAMKRENRAALVRYAYSARSMPRLGLLIPTTEQGSRHSDQIQCFMFVTLPFAEDCRTYEFPSLNDPKLEPSSEQLSLVDDLITSMDLISAKVDENGRRCEAYDPVTVADPHIQHTYACLAFRALHEDGPLPPVNSQLVASISPLEEKMQLTKDLFAKLRSAFQLKKNEDKKAKRTANDIFQPGEPGSGGPPTKVYKGAHQVKPEEDIGSTTISTIRPVEDYAELIDKDAALFEEASDKLGSIVHNFIFNAVDTQFYDKAANCVDVYRRKSVDLSKPGVFNNWIRQLKSLLIDASKDDFLQNLSTRKSGLISTDECPTSHVSVNEAETFFDQERKPKKELPTQDSTQEPDLLDELE